MAALARFFKIQPSEILVVHDELDVLPGQAKLKRSCSLPLTAAKAVDFVVTDLGVFEVQDGHFVLLEWFPPYSPEYILATSDADIVVASDCKQAELD